LIFNKIKLFNNNDNKVFFICEYFNLLIIIKVIYEVYYLFFAFLFYFIFDKVEINLLKEMLK